MTSKNMIWKLMKETHDLVGGNWLDHEFGIFPYYIGLISNHPNGRTPSFFRGVFPLAHQPVKDFEVAG